MSMDQTFLDRKSTRLNSSHANISYAVFCLKKKTELVLKSRRVLPARLLGAGFRFEFQDLVAAARDLVAGHRALSARSRPLAFFFFIDAATTEIYPFSLHDAPPI